MFTNNISEKGAQAKQEPVLPQEKIKYRYYSLMDVMPFAHMVRM